MVRRPRALRLRAYLEHIVDAAERIRSYTAGQAEEQFLKTPITQDAVIRNLEVIGEACRNVLRYHDEFAIAHETVPWHAPYEMRNALIHGYFSIDLIQTWATVRDDIPPFETQIRALLTALDAQSPPDDPDS
jgi:uncharacterized protein with HEPN domain